MINGMSKSYSFVSEDGVFVRLEETPERERIILSLSREGKVETASLSKSMFDSIMELRYNLDVKRPRSENKEEEA